MNPRQLEAITAPDGPLLITAGAGSGKAKTLTARLLYLIDKGVPAESIVAITFTNKAAGEMKSRAEALLRSRGFKGFPFIGTFHSLSARFLRSEARFLGREPSFSIYDDDDSTKVVKNALKALDIDKDKRSVSGLKNKISKVKNELLDPADFAEEDARFFAVYRKYEEMLLEQNAFDFDDLIGKLAFLFETRPEVLSRYHDRFTHFLVDEYQDVNTAQYRLTSLLAARHRNLNVVGDDHQSIYSFRSADFRNFLNFEKDYPEAKIVTLDQNYRSTKTIIGAASAVIAQNKYQRPKTLWTENEDGEPIKVSRFPRADKEADWIADSILGESYDSTAILYRTNAQSRPIEQALIFNRIPYAVFGGLKFYDRKEIKDIVAAMRLTANPKDGASAERILKEFGKIRGRKLIEVLPQAASFTPTELIGYVLKETDYATALKKEFKNFEERMENLSELIAFSNNFSSLQEMIERISLLESSDSPRGDEKNAVRLMTIHMAKGLEFDSVYLAGVDDGVLPHERSLLSADDIEEERRLMYVAMTRARKKLRMSFWKAPSRFLFEMPPELVDFDNFEFDDDTVYLS